MEDAIADESYRVLAASLAGAPGSPALAGLYPERAQPEPSPASGSVPALRAATPDEVERVVAPLARSTGYRQWSAAVGEGRAHHTLVPRLMVVTAMVAALGAPLFLFGLFRQGHFDVAGRDWYFDDRGRRLAVAGASAVGACFCLGWCWWTAAAAANARNRARYSASPFLGPLAMAAAGGCVYLLPRAIDARTDATDADVLKLTVLCVTLAVVPFLAYFVTVGTFSRTARAIGAAHRPWIVTIVLPWMMLGLNLFSRFFTEAVGDSYLTVTGVVNLAFIVIYVLAAYVAMRSFDRTCAGRLMAHDARVPLDAFTQRRVA
jgi:hypothetical protein